MLPDRHAVSIIVGKLVPKKGGESPSAPPPEADDDGLTTAADELIESVSRKDAQAVAAALRAAFDILESQPHEEGPHDETDDEDEQ